MAEPVGSLRVDVAANTAQIKSDMNAIKGMVASGVAGINSSLGKMGSQSLATAAAMGSLRGGMQALQTFMAGALTRQMIDAAAQIGNLSARLNLSTDQFQVWSYAAKTVGASTEDMVKIFEKLNEKLGEVSTDVTPTQIALSRLGLTIVQLRNLNPDEQLKVIADRLAAIQSPAQRAAIASELLGDKANDMLAMFAKGRAGIEGIAKEMRDFGLILSSDTIQKAQAANREFQVIETLSGNAGKTIAAEMLPALREFRMLLTDPGFRSGMGGFVELLKLIGEGAGYAVKGLRYAFQGPAILQAAGVVGDLSQELIKAKDAMDQMAAAGQNTEEASARYNKIAAQLADAKKKLEEVSNLSSKALETPDAKRDPLAGFDAKKAIEVQKAVKDLTFQFELLSGDFDKVAAGFPQLAYGLGIFDVSARQAYVHTGELTGNLKLLESAQLSLNAAKLNEDMKTPLQKYNDEVARLNQLMGTGLVTQETFNLKLKAMKENFAQAAASGVTIQSPLQQYQDRIKNLNDLLAKGVLTQKLYNEEVIKAQDAYAQASNAAISYKQTGDIVGKATENALEGMIIEGKSWSDAMRGFVREVIAELIRMLVIKKAAGLIGSAVTGGLSGGLSSLFLANGGVIQRGKLTAFAKGGVVSGPTTFPMRGGVGLMGEAGPEAVMPLERGPDGRLGVRNHGSGNSSVFNIDARGADAGVADRILNALAMADRNRPDAASAVAAARKRFPTRG